MTKYARWVIEGSLKRKKVLGEISENSGENLSTLNTNSSGSSSFSRSHNRCSPHEKINWNETLPVETKYVRLYKVGEGTYGRVYKAYYKDNENSFVALKAGSNKKNDPIPKSTYREIFILRMLNHENVLKFIDVCRSDRSSAHRFESDMILVTEYCEHDLSGLLTNPNVHFTLGEVKMLIKQLFMGIAYIHKKNILHRDLKTPNILLTKEGSLKLADFGLARSIKKKSSSENKCLTNLVATLWYRSPELLLGEENYGTAIDNWSAGCIMAEMWKRKPILMGNTEQQQLKFISRLCGSITPVVWPDVVKLKLYNSLFLPDNLENRMVDYLMSFVKDIHACNLIEKLLTLDPMKRITAAGVLQDQFFTEAPLPCNLRENLLNFTRSSSQLKVGYSTYHHGLKRKREFINNKDGHKIEVIW